MNNIVILGQVGSGKDWLLKEIVEKYNLDKVITDTTRPMRDGEINGFTYNFITNDEFEFNLSQGKYIEHQVYNTVAGNWYYGTSKESIKKDNSIIVLDKDGYIEYKKNIPNCISFYITCVDETKRFYLSLKRLKSIDMSDVEEVYRRITIDNDKFKEVHKIVDFTVPQTYDDMTIETVFGILDKLNIKRRYSE